MKRIKIADATLCRAENAFSFKEKIDIARQLEKLDTDVIELPEIQNVRIDTLLIKTISTFVKKSTVSVAAGMSIESVENAAAALSTAAHSCIRIELPTSPVSMEYVCHKKPDKMIAWIEKIVAFAKEKCSTVEFCALDASRAEAAFLALAVNTAIAAGADEITLCDDAGEMLPDDFAAFVKNITDAVSVPVSIRCSNQNSMACANAIMAIRTGANGVKTAVGEAGVSLESFAAMVKNCGNRYGFYSDIRYTELHRTVKQIGWVLDNVKSAKGSVTSLVVDDEPIHLDANDDKDTVVASVIKLGYDLSEEDKSLVYQEFLRVAAKKKVGAKELEAIVASVALQVPPTYELINYVVNSGNVISTSAQITLRKDGKDMPGISIGDGPIDAAFSAIEQIIGHRYELDDFQIQSVTEGTEAMGAALVKLRSEGKLYSGNGISTDIIGAGIRAYINAVNKIVYEEAAQ
jgi:2-isopropylmalate synthase